MNAIEINGLVKRYGDIEALRGVDLKVPEGAIFGLVGPNGAGKTTLIKSLVGSLRPTAGEVRVLGLDPHDERARLRQRIGYMPQSSVLYEDLSARANVSFFGSAHTSVDLSRRVAEVLEFTDLSGRADDPVHTYSGGMKHRASLAAALVHEPELLLLDEPSAGVDPKLRRRFWEQFRELAGNGTTVFVTTHLMEEASLCDRIAILRQGRIIACDSPGAILRRGKVRLVVERNGEVLQTVVSDPGDVAKRLHAHGLSREVTSVSIDAEPMESVVLSLIDQEEDR